MMDSGNSGSLQSSSGGDDEYESRAAAAADSVSAFMGGGPISNPAPAFFDPLSNYPSLLNPSMAWPRASTPAPRSDPNPITHDMIINPMLSSSPSFMPAFQHPAAVGVDSSSPTLTPPPPQNQNQMAARNPKKRSRASRRAPTTVLTTDTTNFRAMVQEFTGIPAPPFSNSSFPRSRLDLFGTRSTSLDAANPPPYLRRPFAQKVQSPLPFLASSCNSLLSSTAADAMAASSTTTNNNIITTSSVSSATTAPSSSTPQINYQLPITQSSNLFNLPTNPLLASLLQTNPKFPFSNSPAIGSKPHNSFEIPSNDQFGNLGRESHLPITLNGLQNLIASDQIAPQQGRDRNDNTDSNNAARWDNNPASLDGDKDNLRPVSGGFSFPRNTINGKMKYSASSMSNFQGEKGPPENVAAARGEGMVESWICSSSE